MSHPRDHGQVKATSNSDAPGTLVELPTPRDWRGLVRNVEFSRAILHLFGLARFASGLLYAIVAAIALFFGTAFIGRLDAPDITMWIVFLAVGIFNILLGMSLTGCNHGARKAAAAESLCQIVAVVSLAVVGVLVTGLSLPQMIALAALAGVWNATSIAILLSPTIKKACDGKAADSTQTDKSFGSYGPSGIITEIAVFLFAVSGVALAAWVAYTAVSVVTPPQPLGIIG